MSKIIAKRLRDSLGSKKQAELVRLTDVSSAAVANWFKKGSVGKEHIFIVAKFLGLRPEEIVFEDPENEATANDGEWEFMHGVLSVSKANPISFRVMIAGDAKPEHIEKMLQIIQLQKDVLEK